VGTGASSRLCGSAAANWCKNFESYTKRNPPRARGKVFLTTFTASWWEWNRELSDAQVAKANARDIRMLMENLAPAETVNQAVERLKERRVLGGESQRERAAKLDCDALV
jgi:hypothetical protein